MYTEKKLEGNIPKIFMVGYLGRGQPGSPVSFYSGFCVNAIFPHFLWWICELFFRQIKA